MGTHHHPWEASCATPYARKMQLLMSPDDRRPVCLLVSAVMGVRCHGVGVAAMRVGTSHIILQNLNWLTGLLERKENSASYPDPCCT